MSHPTNELYPKQIIIYVIHFNLYFFREEEGKDLLGKRTMDFKVSYLDAGFATSYFDGDCPSPTGVAGGGGGSSGPKLNPRRYKTQLRDFLSSCRTKRKPLLGPELYADAGGGGGGVVGVGGGGFSAYAHHSAGGMYGGGGGSYPGASADPSALYMQQATPAAAAAAYSSLYSGVDNRYLATDYFTAAAGYRSLGSYYPEYHLSGGYLDSGRLHSLAEADKLYSSSAAAAYMSADPRGLCGSLRLPTAVSAGDMKNGKDGGHQLHHHHHQQHLQQHGGKLVVKEEGGLHHHTDYLLGGHHPDHQPAYTLPDQVQGTTSSSSILYMCADSPSSRLYHGGSPPGAALRLTSGGPSDHHPGKLASGEVMLSTSVPSSSSSSSCCTFSLSDMCGVSAVQCTASAEALSAQEVFDSAHC